MKLHLMLPACLSVFLVLSGCGKKDEVVNSNKVRIGYIGITCEAPLFMAQEQGFFKEEGLEVEMLKFEWSQYKDALALGRFDITHHLIMMFLKPIEQGLDVKMTAGVHKGCLRVQVAGNSPIQTMKELRGKRIGCPGMGTPPFIFANRVLGANGIDGSKEIIWKAYPSGELGLALERGEVDAIANSEPIGTLLLNQKNPVRNIADQAKDAPYKDEYCCAVIVNGKFFAANPKTTAAATRAILKGAKWVQTNPAAAARLSVEKKYIAAFPELNTTAIGNLNYIPSVEGGRDAVRSAATEMKIAGMLNPSTNVEELAKKAFVQLDGVSDEWIKGLEVQKVAGGQITTDQPIRLAVEIATMVKNVAFDTCCSPAKPAAATTQIQ
jgi:NitT/TauT family transport system substrate-binding protein